MRKDLSRRAGACPTAWPLAEKDGGTLLSYHVEAQIGGKLARLGQRLINGTAKKLADEFFANFEKVI
jgi:uncharacterized protein